MKRKITAICLVFFFLASSLIPMPASVFAEEAGGLEASAEANDPPIIGTDHPTEPGEVMLFKEAKPVPGMVNTWEVTLRIEAKDDIKTSAVVLVMDRSGSMKGERMTNAKAAAKAFVDELLPSDTTRIGVVSFAGDVRTNQGLTNNQNALNTAIDGLDASGGTFTQAGVRQAIALLDNSDADYKHIVVLSDGEPTYSYALENPDDHLIDEPDYSYTSTKALREDYLDSRIGEGNDITFRYKKMPVESTEGEYWRTETTDMDYVAYYNSNGFLRRPTQEKIDGKIYFEPVDGMDRSNYKLVSYSFFSYDRVHIIV